MIRRPASQKSNVRPGAQAVGRRLRDMFESISADPMPGHLVDLVDQLERAHEARQAEAGVGEPRSLLSETT